MRTQALNQLDTPRLDMVQSDRASCTYISTYRKEGWKVARCKSCGHREGYFSRIMQETLCIVCSSWCIYPRHPAKRDTCTLIEVV